MGRLTLENNEDNTIRYDYDLVGNRLKKATQEATLNYQYSIGNRLQGINEQAVKKDPQGNTLKVGSGQMLYNINNRPAAYFNNEELLAAYRYNVLGQRTEKLFPGKQSLLYRYVSAQ